MHLAIELLAHPPANLTPVFVAADRVLTDAHYCGCTDLVLTNGVVFAVVVIRCFRCEEHSMTPCTTGCKKLKVSVWKPVEDFVNRHPSVGSTLAVTNTSDEGFELTHLRAVQVTNTW